MGKGFVIRNLADCVQTQPTKALLLTKDKCVFLVAQATFSTRPHVEFCTKQGLGKMVALTPQFVGGWAGALRINLRTGIYMMNMYQTYRIDVEETNVC